MFQNYSEAAQNCFLKSCWRALA